MPNNTSTFKVFVLIISTNILLAKKVMQQSPISTEWENEGEGSEYLLNNSSKHITHHFPCFSWLHMP